MKRLLILAVSLIGLLAVAACQPITPTPVPPTVGPVQSPTPNFRATEASIISHVLATLTASAPTATRPAPPPPPPTVALRTATATRVRAAPPAPPANTPVAPPGSGPTRDPYLAQIPKGMGGILVANYVGDRQANFSVAGQAYLTQPNSKTLITLAPGKYNITVQILGGIGSWTDEVTVVADRYQIYNITLRQ